MNLSKELIQGIVNYLSGQPYAQVAALMQALKNEVEAQQDKPDDTD